jgi:hypothetical protein
MFAIRDYEGFDFVFDSFDLQAFENIELDTDLFFQRFPEYNKANTLVMACGRNYQNAYKWTTYWDDDHNINEDADI